MAGKPVAAAYTRLRPVLNPFLSAVAAAARGF